MKTQVIQLEPHDDIISARDKMGWGKTRRVVLVWPKRRKVLNRQLDLVLLQRYSKEIGAQLGFVSRDPDVKFHAFELGIPVFPTVHKAQTTRWRKVRRGRRPPPHRPEVDPALEAGEAPLLDRLTEMRDTTRSRKPAWLSEPSYRLGLFSAGVLAILAIISVLVPSAEITLYPATQVQTARFTVQAGPGDTPAGPASEIQSYDQTVTVEGRAEVETTGQIQIPGAPARGAVKFLNLTDQLVNVPAGTVVRTLDPQPARFMTTESGRLLPGTDESVNLPVEALTRGEVGNLPADTLRGIEGPLGLQLAVTNPLPTLGGQDTVAPAPTAADRRQIYETLLASLQETAAAELAALVAPGDQILSAAPMLVEIHEEVYDPPDSQPADRLTLLLQLEFTVPVAPGEDIEALVTAVMDRSVAEGYRPQPGSLEIVSMDDPMLLPGGQSSWEIQATRTLVAELTENQAVNLTLGLAPSQAQARLMASMDLADPPQIEMRPSWWPRLPILPFRIQVEEALNSSVVGLSTTNRQLD